MKKSLLLLFFIPGLLHAQHQKVAIRIIQDQTIPLDSFDTHILLQQKAFKIQVMLENTDGVYCFACFKDSLYRLSVSDPVPGFAALPGMAMAEPDNNKEKELMVSETGWSYWYYDAKISHHRFNKKVVLLDGGKVVGTKSIKQIYFVQQDQVSKFKQIHEPLYLFFVAVAGFDKDGNPDHELMRRKIRIDWLPED
jgi:hypothetical protein